MLTAEQNKVIENIKYIINVLKGHKNRYRISIVPNYFNYQIHVEISIVNNESFIYRNIIQANKDTYINVINVLRNNFIFCGALVSKLSNNLSNKETTYYRQDIYLYNLEMSVQINNKQEELEAAKAHKKVMVPDTPSICTIESHIRNRKTIRLKNYIG